MGKISLAMSMPHTPSASLRLRSTKVLCLVEEEELPRERRSKRNGWRYVHVRHLISACISLPVIIIKRSITLYNIIGLGFIAVSICLQRVKQSSSTAKVSGRVASLLEKIAEYPNVPRKRKKFEVSDQI